MTFFKGIILLFIIFGSRVRAKAIYNEVSLGLGMVNASFAETESTLEAEDPELESEPESGAASVTSVFINYNLFSYDQKVIYAKGTVPFMGSTGSTFFSAGIGMKFFFNSISSKVGFNDRGSQIRIVPKMRYYAGFETGVSYLVYLVTSAKKSDMLFDFGGTGGLMYNFNQTWGMEAQFSASMGIGAATNSTIMKMLVGATYFFGN